MYKPRYINWNHCCNESVCYQKVSSWSAARNQNGTRASRSLWILLVPVIPFALGDVLTCPRVSGSNLFQQPPPKKVAEEFYWLWKIAKNRRRTRKIDLDRNRSCAVLFTLLVCECWSKRRSDGRCVYCESSAYRIKCSIRLLAVLFTLQGVVTPATHCT
jgi:hypothetical protein